ncbi:MAG: ABC transporter substrate-binding protein [Phycisphaeraceae bacterium]
MKLLFAAIAVVLAAAAFGTWWSYPDQQSEVPVIYWVTDRNPARDMQVELFHQWLVKNGYTVPGAEGKPEPAVRLRLDTANREVSKQVIQGVSGVAGDLLDIGSGTGMRYFQSIGLLRDVTDWGRQLKFDPSYTYAAIEPEITLDGRQYMFPCNVAVTMYWIHKGTFEKYGVPVPPKRWTFDQFEAIGKQLVEAANPPGQRRTVFFADGVVLELMYRSLGLGKFNETGTRCTLDDPRFVAVLERVYKWTYVDHLLPTAADRQGFDTQQGYGGPTLQLFNSGNFAMFYSGRYALIQLRKFKDPQGGPLALSVSEPPHGGFPSTTIATRAAGMYIGSPNPELARLFQAFLASEDYNMQIVRDADALPPIPQYAQTELFNRPPDHPNEWGCHEMFFNAAQDIAIGGDYSPFVLDTIANREVNRVHELFMNDMRSAKEAAAEVAQRVNAEIARSLQEQPKLRARYDQLVQQQKLIDQYKAQGKAIPLELVTSTFYRAYYRRTNQAAPETDENAP